MQEEAQAPDGVSIHMGFPNPAADKSLASLDLNTLLVTRKASTYLFRIRGKDWADLGIMDGDVAVVDRALGVRKTDIVVWWSAEHGEFSLSHPGAMPEDASVWGVVTSTIHQFRKDDT